MSFLSRWRQRRVNAGSGGDAGSSTGRKPVTPDPATRSNSTGDVASLPADQIALLKLLILEQRDTNLLLRALCGALSRAGFEIAIPRGYPARAHDGSARSPKITPYTDRDVQYVSRETIYNQQIEEERARQPHNHPMAEQVLEVADLTREILRRGSAMPEVTSPTPQTPATGVNVSFTHQTTAPSPSPIATATPPATPSISGLNPQN